MSNHTGSGRAALALLCLTLAACQGQNPYTQQSTPLPPAPEAGSTSAQVSYPAAPLEYSRYRTWSWRSVPAGTASVGAQQLQEIIAGALDQRGLRPAAAGAPADLQVSGSARTETRTRQVHEPYGTHYGYGRGYGSNIGMWGSAPMTHTYQEEVLVVRLELHDSASGQPVWSGQAQARSGASQSEREKALREAVDRALADYPPR